MERECVYEKFFFSKNRWSEKKESGSGEIIINLVLLKIDGERISLCLCAIFFSKNR